MRKIFASVLVVLATVVATAQDVSKNTLFEYPSAPDTCTTLESRCDYIIIHFWDNYDITKPIKDVEGFTKAFHDYIDFFKYANKAIVESSIRTFMFKAQSNTSNLLKLGSLAEESLYGPHAQYWSDEAYMPFAQAMAGSKQLKKDVRNYYSAQVEKIKRNTLGSVMPDIEWTDATGLKRKLSGVTTEGLILIMFSKGGFDDDMARLRLGTDLLINDMISTGDVQIIDLAVSKYSGEWASKTKDYPQNWQVGACPDAEKLLDLREFPSFYVIDKDRVILNKNMSPDGVKAAFSGR